jgi:hypothetical protein
VAKDVKSLVISGAQLTKSCCQKLKAGFRINSMKVTMTPEKVNFFRFGPGWELTLDLSVAFVYFISLYYQATDVPKNSLNSAEVP